jgi:peptidoglycan-N-acetylglucosamine deacetylase
MHDREWTNAALEDIINGIRNKGYEFINPALIKTLP